MICYFLLFLLIIGTNYELLCVYLETEIKKPTVMLEIIILSILAVLLSSFLIFCIITICKVGAGKTPLDWKPQKLDTYFGDGC
jgi:hypothetical protein